MMPTFPMTGLLRDDSQATYLRWLDSDNQREFVKPWPNDC
jgi:hypothetical protein